MLAKQLEFREQQLQTRLEPVEAQHRQAQTLHDDLKRKEQDLSVQIKTFEREQKEFIMKRDQWAHEQGSILTRVGQQKSALAQAEETLRQQRQDLDDLLQALQEGKLPGALDGVDPAELQVLRRK